MKFSICTIASFGETMRKYATAFTRTGTLSFVMTSCGGTVSVIVRRSTLTILSTTGISRKRPGPFGTGSKRPSRKTMPRSYSRATLIAEKRNRTTRNSRIAMMTRAALIGLDPTSVGLAGGTSRVPQAPSTGPLRGGALRVPYVSGPHSQHEPVKRLAADSFAGPQLFSARSARPPELPVDEHEPVTTPLADRAGDHLRRHLDRLVPHLPRLADGE